MNVSLSIFAPGFRLPKLSPGGPPPFSCRCCGELLAVTFSGRVTDMSVPTPVSGFSTRAWASSRPVERALTVTTRPTPTASPSAVRIVRPLRRRSSANMYDR